MKGIFFTLLTSCFFVAAQAQIITMDPVVESLLGTATNPDEELHGESTIINNTAGTLNLRCISDVVTLVSGAKYQYCWGQTCSPWTSNDGNLEDVVTLAPGESTPTFYFKYRPYENAGVSEICYTWFDINNSELTFTHCVKFCIDAACEVGVKEIKATANIGSISPNPVVKTAMVDYDFAAMPNNGKVKIHNMVGSLMKVIDLTSKAGMITIEAADYENGIYFISIENEGKVFETKRLVIAK